MSSAEHYRPLLGITMGDPAGIGPEIIAKAAAMQECTRICRPLIIGDAGVMTSAVSLTGVNLEIHRITGPEDFLDDSGILNVLDQKTVDPGNFKVGKVSAMGGRAAYLAIAKAIELAMDGRIDGTVSAPLNKEALRKAGYHFPGHTEIYASLTGTTDYAMMLADKHFRVAHVSTHVSLRQACDRATRKRVLTVIRLADAVCRQLGIDNPRIGVAGLNPHAGENGLFGDEEINEIDPAIVDAVKEGINAQGPIPPDTIYAKLKSKYYDIVVAMYHDQGHIPTKLVGFTFDEEHPGKSSMSGVNITLGLPVVRSSVDHGTAFDIAGTGKANAESMLQAVEYGALLSGKIENSSSRSEQ